MDRINYQLLSDLIIENNPQLSVCAVRGLCFYLGDELNAASIIGNAPACNDRETIEINCLAVGVSEIDQQIKLFPNPTNGILNLDGVRAERVQVFNTQGHLLNSFTNPDSELNLSGLPSGVYYFQLQAGDNTYMARVMKVQ